MDASAFISPEEWNALLERLELDEERICEGRYDHVVHMVTNKPTNLKLKMIIYKRISIGFIILKK